MKPALLPILLVLASLSSACPKTPVPDQPAGWDHVPGKADMREVLGPTDVFEVRVYEEEDLSGIFRLDSDGTFVYPLLGTLQAEGKTAGEIAEDIRAGLADGYLLEPQVTVFVQEYNSRKVSVLGEVKRPGRYTYRQGMTLVEAIAEAGGTGPSAALSMMKVTRTVDGEEHSIDVPFKEITRGRVADFPLLPGDIVFVSESAVR